MSKTLSREEFQKRFDEKCGGKLELVTQYINRRIPIMVRCVDCGHEYPMHTSTIMYRDNKLKACPNCSKPIVICDYCGKEFRKRRTEIERTERSYCSIQCRNRALNDARRVATLNNYRKIAFANYEHKCAVCGWNEDSDILEVHHIDENREHNEVGNLIILCPICHRKLTSKKYKLVGNEIIGV